MIARAATAAIARLFAGATAYPSNPKGATKMIETMPTLVVFGLDPEGKPRAARFAEPDAELAIKAASLLGYRAVRISDAEILDALRDGDVFSRGNGFIGRVSRSVFDKLTAVAGKDQDEALGAAPEKAGL